MNFLVILPVVDRLSEFRSHVECLKQTIHVACAPNVCQAFIIVFHSKLYVQILN